MPGVGSLSQSTICRFESLTLSHNNMVALKPILHSWLEKVGPPMPTERLVTTKSILLMVLIPIIQAEEAVKAKDGCGEISGILPNTDKKRKRTSIAAPEKRLLEDYFRYVLQFKHTVCRQNIMPSTIGNNLDRPGNE